jgi:hypothetical protein
VGRKKGGKEKGEGGEGKEKGREGRRRGREEKGKGEEGTVWRPQAVRAVSNGRERGEEGRRRKKKEQQGGGGKAYSGCSWSPTPASGASRWTVRRPSTV